jgi:hypothetical protein
LIADLESAKSGLQKIKILPWDFYNVLNYVLTNILDFDYKSYLISKFTFKYNSGRLSITLQKKKFCPEGVRHEKKSISKTPCLLY